MSQEPAQLPSEFQRLWDSAQRTIRPQRQPKTDGLYVLPTSLRRGADLIEESASYHKFLDAPLWDPKPSAWRIRETLRPSSRPVPPRREGENMRTAVAYPARRGSGRPSRGHVRRRIATVEEHRLTATQATRFAPPVIATSEAAAWRVRRARPSPGRCHPGIDGHDPCNSCVRRRNYAVACRQGRRKVGWRGQRE
jgi:hypothetical protein